jgi:hypothetical protein
VLGLAIRAEQLRPLKPAPNSLDGTGGRERRGDDDEIAAGLLAGSSLRS